MVYPPNSSHYHCWQSCSHIHQVFTCTSGPVPLVCGAAVNQALGSRVAPACVMCGSCKRRTRLVSCCGLAVMQQPAVSIRAADRFHADCTASYLCSLVMVMGVRQWGWDNEMSIKNQLISHYLGFVLYFVYLQKVPLLQKTNQMKYNDVLVQKEPSVCPSFVQATRPVHLSL